MQPAVGQSKRAKGASSVTAVHARAKARVRGALEEAGHSLRSPREEPRLEEEVIHPASGAEVLQAAGGSVESSRAILRLASTARPHCESLMTKEVNRRSKRCCTTSAWGRAGRWIASSTR